MDKDEYRYSWIHNYENHSNTDEEKRNAGLYVVSHNTREESHEILEMLGILDDLKENLLQKV